MGYHFLNGQFVDETHFVISARDLGLTRGFAVFEFLRSFGHQPFMLDAHITRLYQSAAIIGLTIPWEQSQVTEWVLHTLSKNTDGKDKVIKILISGGSSITMKQANTPSITIAIDDFIPFPDSLYTNGVTAILHEYERPNPAAKTTQYIEAVRLAPQLETTKAYEAIYHSDNKVREGTRSNIFACIDGMFVTPTTSILPGITRKILLEDKRSSQLCIEGELTLSDLKLASEVFITATAAAIVPVVCIDQQPVADGQVGSLTKQLMNLKLFSSKSTWTAIKAEKI